jgi:glycosyltransferase involved in cell wall biosynthesis
VKIAILGTKGLPGHHGVEVVVESLCPHLAELGHQITVYGYESYCGGSASLRHARVKTMSGASSKNLEMISHMWLASCDTRRRDYDIIHIHSTDPCLLAWLPRSRSGVIATSHGQAYLRQKWNPVAKIISRVAEILYAYMPRAITSVSRPLADFYRYRYHRQVHYIPNGIQISAMPSERHLARFGLQTKGFLFCSAGRIEKTKGLHTLLQAYARAQTELPLIIAGGGKGSDGRYYESLKHQAPPNVRFVGFLTGELFYSLYAHAAVFVFPSEYEAMSMALLEGLSYGTPTIYSDLPENQEVAKGIAFPFTVGDADALAQKIGWVLNHRKQAKEMGARAKARIREHHNWHQIAQQYDRLYRQIAVKH